MAIPNPKLLERFIETTSDFVLWMDGEGQILFANPALCKALQYAAEDLIGQPVWKIDPQWNPIVWDLNWQTLKSQGSLRTEQFFRNKEGDKIPCDLTSNLIVVDGKEICYSVIKDSSSRREQEHRLHTALREANQFRFALTQGTIILSTNAKGIITSANDSFLKIMGFTLDEIRGKSARVLRSAKHDLAFYENQVQTIKAGRVWRSEVCNLAKDGSEVWFDMVIVPFRSEFGEIEEFMSISYDITEKKLQADQIKKNEAALSDAQKISRLGSFEYDLGLKKGWWSPQAVENYGFPPGTDLNLVDWSKVISETDQALMKELMHNAFKKRERFENQIQISKAGKTAYLNLIGTPVFGEAGQPARVVGTVQDVTEKVIADRLLKEQQAKLIHASKMSTLGQMAGGVAHEINNPLAIIHGNATLLQEFLNSDEIDKGYIQKSTDRIISTVERIAKIVQGLRTFAHGGASDPFTTMSVADMVQETLAFCESRFRSSGIGIEVGKIASDLTVDCRPNEISQVLLNLLNNSFDAVQGNAPAWVHVDVVDHAERVEIRVTDSGPGIADEIADKIMEPFFTTKEIGKGTGLGLSISTGIAEAHQGTLVLDRNCKNTRLVLQIPKKQQNTKKDTIKAA
ncbi:MAG: PAS domain S-box protein [Bdellovibrionales bacterium]|nr:PAS domain S-box protein [Bdellovibrionales bacterium]